MVKVDPAAVFSFDNALGPQDHAVLGLVIQRGKDAFDLVLGEFFRCLAAPAGEDLVGVVPMVMVMMAAAVRVVALVAVRMLVMRMVAAVLVMVMLVVVMMVAAAVVIMVVVMIVMAAARLVMILVIVVVMMLMLVLMVMVVVMGLLVLQRGQLQGQGLGLLDGLLHLNARQLVPRGGDDGGRVVVAAEHRDDVVDLFVRHLIRPAQDDAGCRVDLVFIEFAEAAHVDIAAGGVDDCGKGAQLNRLRCLLLDGGDDVAELADAGGLDQDALGAKFPDDLLQRAAKVAHQGAADAAGVDLRNLNAGLLQKRAVDADIAKLILNEDKLFAVIGFFDELFDQGRLPCAEETGKNVNACHTLHLLR